MEMVQLTLQCGTTRTVGFVENQPGLKPGNAVSLIGDDRIWEILVVSRPINKLSIKRNWNNNI